MTRDLWQDAAAYDGFVGRWSRPVADGFLDWLGVPAGATWIDVGCGTGALSERVLARAAPAALLGIDPQPAFIEIASGRLASPVARFEVGSADALPVDDDSVDAVVSGLVLPFLPDLRAALAEKRRATRQGGLVAAYVWDYAGRMELLRRFFDAAIHVDPAAAEHDEGRMFPIAAPDRLAAAWSDAGFRDVRVTAIDVPTRFADFDDYWRPFTRSVGHAPVYAGSLPPAQRDAIRERLRETLPTNPDGTIDLIARAWAVQGRT